MKSSQERIGGKNEREESKAFEPMQQQLLGREPKQKRQHLAEKG